MPSNSQSFCGAAQNGSIRSGQGVGKTISIAGARSELVTHLIVGKKMHNGMYRKCDLMPFENEKITSVKIQPDV